MSISDNLEEAHGLNFLYLLDESNYHLLCVKCKSYQERSMGLGRGLKKGEQPNCEKHWSKKKQATYL